jgi:hypothetical protein
VHGARQVGAGEDRTTALIEDHVQTRDRIQNGMELKEDQAASDSEQEDLFDEDEDATSVEAAINEDDRNIERVIIDEDGMAWINIPTEVARDLISVGNRGRDTNPMIEETRCLAVNLVIDREGDTQQMLMAAPVCDTHAVDQMEQIIEGMARDLTRRVNTTLYYERQEEARIKATERDTRVYILLYVPDEDMVSVALTNRYLGDKVQEARNTEQRYVSSLARCVHKFINLLRE